MYIFWGGGFRWKAVWCISARHELAVGRDLTVFMIASKRVLLNKL